MAVWEYIPCYVHRSSIMGHKVRQEIWHVATLCSGAQAETRKKQNLQNSFKWKSLKHTNTAETFLLQGDQGKRFTTRSDGTALGTQQTNT